MGGGCFRGALKLYKQTMDPNSLLLSNASSIKLACASGRFRLGKKNDNPHIERWNRTIQDEYIGAYPDFNQIKRNVAFWQDFYNRERLHLGLQCRTPIEILQIS